MNFATLPLLLSFLPATLAQGYGGGNYGSGSTSTSSAAAGSPSSTPTSSSSNIHVVQVGNGGLTFSPNSFNASIGDIVEFQFYPPLHSVAQSNFENPCSPRNGTGVTSFYSGPVSTTSGSNANVFSLMINDTSTIWVYCGVPTHCESGMSADQSTVSQLNCLFLPSQPHNIFIGVMDQRLWLCTRLQPNQSAAQLHLRQLRVGFSGLRRVLQAPPEHPLQAPRLRVLQLRVLVLRRMEESIGLWLHLRGPWHLASEA